MWSDLGYNRDNYKKIRADFESKHLRAIEAAEQREAALHAEFPELEEIDRALSETGFRILEVSAAKSGEQLEKEMQRLKEENMALQQARSMFLEQKGYPSDYTAPVYECRECSDTGYSGIEMCRCMREALVRAGYESSGIGKLINTQSFETFDPEYQRDDARAYENLKMALKFCRDYADSFPESGRKNMLFMGNTGLGKTHLSTAIAKRVIERGFDVVYDTAQNIFSDFEFERFSRSYNSNEPPRTDKFFDCDLLIIDDLGTEMTNQFTISCLYNLINTRINQSKGMIINTNITRDELRKRYADRITSRLFGEFVPIMFYGGDVRAKKL